MLAAAYKEGYSIDKLYELTKIDKWFLSRMKCIMDYALLLKNYREKAEVRTNSSDIFLSSITYPFLNQWISYYCQVRQHKNNSNLKNFLLA